MARSTLLSLLQENEINYIDVYIYSPTLHKPGYISLKNSYELIEEIIKNKAEQSFKRALLWDAADKRLIDPVELNEKQNHVTVFDDVRLEDQTSIKKVFLF